MAKKIPLLCSNLKCNKTHGDKPVVFADFDTKEVLMFHDMTCAVKHIYEQNLKLKEGIEAIRKSIRSI